MYDEESGSAEAHMGTLKVSGHGVSSKGTRFSIVLLRELQPVASLSSAAWE